MPTRRRTISTVSKRIPRRRITEQPYDEICFVLDRSGSMQSIWNSVKRGFEDFIREQENVGSVRFTLRTFDSQHDELYIRRPINEISTSYIFGHAYPRDTTALLDAVGLTIHSAKERLRNLKGNYPENIIFVVYTDGLENASHEYTRENIRSMIRDCENEGWKFVFMGAGIDAFAEAGAMGFSRVSTKGTQHTNKGAYASHSAASSYVGALRSGLTEDQASQSFDQCYMAIVGEAPTQTAASSTSSSTPPKNKGWKNRRDSKGRFTK